MLTPEDDDLASALKRAATDPAARPDFHRVLLNATVFVLGKPEQDAPNSVTTITAGSRVAIENWLDGDGKAFVPFFSSLEKLQGAIREPRDYMALPAKALFDVTRGGRLILDPGGDYGKEFLPAEIESLLLTGSPVEPERRTLEAGSEVLLGQPKDYPSAMVEALSRFFQKRGDVVAAYLALMHDPLRDKEPHLVVGIECEGDFRKISRDTGVVISASAHSGAPVDLTQVKAGDAGMSQYFLTTPPFFLRDQKRH